MNNKKSKEKEEEKDQQSPPPEPKKFSELYLEKRMVRAYVQRIDIRVIIPGDARIYAEFRELETQLGYLTKLSVDINEYANVKLLERMDVEQKQIEQRLIEMARREGLIF